MKKLFYEYLSFEGRLNRKPYIFRVLIGYTTSVLLYALLEANIISYAVTPLIIISTWFTYASINKRFQDLGKNSLWTAVVFILSRKTILDIPVIVYLAIKEGNNGPNKFGDDPLNTNTRTHKEAPTQNTTTTIDMEPEDENK